MNDDIKRYIDKCLIKSEIPIILEKPDISFLDLSTTWKALIITGGISIGLLIIGLIVVLLIFYTDVIMIDVNEKDIDISKYDHIFDKVRLESELEKESELESELESEPKNDHKSEKEPDSKLKKSKKIHKNKDP
jgi:hypothetical protein